MFLDSVILILMATRVEAHGLLERKIACHAASAVVALASAMAMASMFAATRALSTTAFCPAKVMALGVPFSIAGSTHATTRMLSMFGLTAIFPDDGQAASTGLDRTKRKPAAAPAVVSLMKSRRSARMSSSFRARATCRTQGPPGVRIGQSYCISVKCTSMASRSLIDSKRFFLRQRSYLARW